MDYNLFITSLVLSAIYFCCVVLKCKYITKEKILMKTIAFDSIIVLVLSFLGLNILPLLTKKPVPQAFTEPAKF